MENNKHDLKETALYLMLNASFTRDLGLFRGKVGIAIFFAQYAQFTKETIWDDYAGFLLDEIYEDIHTFLPVNFEDGLCGIGYGIEYLVQNGYMEGNTSDILEQVDSRVMERDPERINDYSLEKGLPGVLLYAYMRIISSLLNNRPLPFDTEYLVALSKASECLLQEETDELSKKIAIIYCQLEQSKQNNWNPDWLWSYLLRKEQEELPLAEQPLGILRGVSGTAMRRMRQIQNQKRKEEIAE